MNNKDVNQLYEDNSDAVYRFIYFIIRHKETAEDLTQETFVKAILNFNNFNHRASVLTWLLKIARNVAYDHLRRKRLNRFFAWGNENDVDTKNLSPTDQAEKKEEITQLYKALARIKMDYRDVIILRKVNEFSIKETAYILGWTEAKVKTKMARGLEALRKEYYRKEVDTDGTFKRV